MTKLESNLYSIAFLTTHLKLSIYTIDEAIKNNELLSLVKFPEEFIQKIGFRKSVIALVSQYSLIQFCSFLDEYKKFNPNHIEKDYSERILKVRDRNKYGIQRINQWKGLYEYRNQIAAHNFDIKKESILRKKELTTYNIPDTFQEKFLFYKISEKICQNIFEEFTEIRDNINLDFNLDKKLNIVKNSNFNLTEELELIKKNM